MKVLIIGNGAREHALCWKVSQSKQVKQIFVAPGNAGTATTAKSANVDIAVTDISALVNFATENAIGLTIVGPEAPLALGIVDTFTAAGLNCFGPTQQAAQLESSKIFSKTFMQRHHIPSAAFMSFDQLDKAIAYIEQQPLPLVIKADGLAAGKGVVIADTKEAAIASATAMLQNKQFGAAGQRIIIEEYLSGEELSFIAIVDGKHILPLASSQDHKRRDDGDKGPNTGGMGAYSPAPLLTPSLRDTIMKTIMEPTVAALNTMNTPYTGFLYAGLMISPQGEAKVLEFNCRLGDPEAQPILLRLRSDLVSLCLAAINQTLATTPIDWDPRPALAVVLASGGYPEHYRKGELIEGLNKHYHDDCKIFHAATQQLDHQVITNGGRVLTVTALGETLNEARQIAYQTSEQISWPGRFFRHDIGHRALTIDN